MTFDDLNKRLKSLVNGVVDKKLMDKIGSETVPVVKKRTRRGFGVNKDGDKAVKLKGISESTKKQRRRLKKQGKLNSETTPAKSNLTRSGKMIDSLDYVASTNEVTISPKGDNNKDKAAGQENQGRSFLNLSKGEIKNIEDIIAEKINNDINKKGL